jgi:hypothetical protein
MRQHNRTYTVTLALLLAAVLCTGFVACGKKDADDTAAPAPRGVSYEGAQLGTAVGGDKSITNPTNDFAPNDTIYVSIETSGTSASTTLAARWTYEDGQEVDRSETTIAPSGPEHTELHISKADGWPEGEYHVEIMLDGRSVETLDFEVEG